MTSAQLINQTSGIVEYYTPKQIIEAARQTMDGIDLDPASSERANQSIAATVYFSQERDGLSQEWNVCGQSTRVWMNHPFGREDPPCDSGCTKKHAHHWNHHHGNHKWIQKLIAEFKSGRVSQACCITFASTSEAWFQPLLRQPQCYLSPRTNYILPNGETLKGVSKGSVVTYFGPNVNRFKTAFESLGVVKV